MTVHTKMRSNPMPSSVGQRGAYAPYEAARRPGGRPSDRPKYRVLVHRQFRDHWSELSSRVGESSAQRFWDHVSSTPGLTSGLANTSILRGRAGVPKGPGWSKTVHYEVSSAGRINYQFNNAYSTERGGDPHPVVFILSIDYSSH